MPDYLEMIKEQNDNVLNDLHKRMDDDAGLLKLSDYVMKDTRGRLVPDIVNVTLDRPRLIAEHIIAALGKVKQQVVVESEDKKVDTAYIESFQKAMFAMADARLRRQGQWQLNPYADEQLSIRGRAVRRILVREENGVLIPDIVPWDARYVTYEMGEEGLAWGAYQGKRLKAAIESEAWAIEKKFVLNKKDAIVTDVWDTEGNYVYVDKEVVWEEKHLWDFCPVVVEVVSLGSMLADEDALQYGGESVFFLIRKAIPELQRLISIMQTLNLLTLKAPIQEATKEGMQAGEYADRMRMGASTPVQIGGGITRIDFGDVKRAAQMALSIIEKAMQEGGLTSVDLGNLQFELSAIALIQIGESRFQVLEPRWNAKGWLNQQTAEMFTRQVIQIGHSVEIGTLGHKRTFEVGKLAGEYETRYSYVPVDPALDVARYTTAAAAREWLDDESILEKIIRDEDPAGTIKRRYYDMAEKISPTVLRTRVIRSLIERAEDGDEHASYEAEVMALEVGMSIEQIKQGNVPQLPAGNGKNQEGLMQLFQSGGRPSSAKRAAQLQGQPREETEE